MIQGRSPMSNGGLLDADSRWSSVYPGGCFPLSASAVPRPERDPKLWAPPSWLRRLEGSVVGFLLLLCAMVIGPDDPRHRDRAGDRDPALLPGLGHRPAVDSCSGTDDPIRRHFGILPLIWGTFVVAVGSSVIALPIGLLSAILPERVRPEAGPRGAQADAGAAGRHPVDRLWLPGALAGHAGPEGDAGAAGPAGRARSTP